ncbi:MAG: hypothetical protein EOP48_18985 [Sphingobacteriales bacterium]|nr:MAG: hypothetical protein EOP48_18985 [Sphingobacteriales bacterium]
MAKPTDGTSPPTAHSRERWYISGLMTAKDSIEFGNYAEKNRIYSINRKLTSYYNDNFEEITKQILRKYPQRKQVLREGIKAHKLAMYYASTTLFLSQADGICSGLLFKNTNKKQNLKKVVSKTKYFDEILNVIIEKSTVDSYHGEIMHSRDNLNRHGIMHGNFVDFGCKRNSLKALSLLSFVSSFT